MRDRKARILGAGVIALVLSSPAAAQPVTAHAPPTQSPIVRLGTEGRTAAAVQVVAMPGGGFHFLWVEKGPPQAGRGHASADDLFVSAWMPGAAVPRSPVRVNAEPGAAKSSPVIRAQLGAGSDSSLHVFYPANARSPVNGKPVVDVRYTRSLDGGMTFSAPVTLNSPSSNDLSSSSHSDIAAAATFPALAVATDGRVHAFWLDSRHVKHTEDPSDVYASTSDDGGATWKGERRLFGGRVCECCQPVALATAQGVLLSSRDVDPAGYRDPVITRFSDDLSPVGAPVRLGAARWKLDGCPMKATALAASGRRVYAAWYSEADAPSGVWVAVSDDGGASFDSGRPIHAAAQAADAPAIATAPDGRLTVAWHAKQDGVRRVFVSTSRDGGRSFTEPVAVSPPGEAASYPALAVQGDETVVAWQQGSTVLATRWGGQPR